MVGYRGEGFGGGGRDFAGTGDYMQDGGTYGVALRYQEFGSYGCYAEVSGGVPPSSGLADHRDVSSEIQGGRMVVSLSMKLIRKR